MRAWVVRCEKLGRQSRMWSFSSLASFTQQTKRKESPSLLWLGKVKTEEISYPYSSALSLALQTYHNLLLLLQQSGSLSYSGRRSIASDDRDSDIRDCMLSFTKEEVLDGDERPVSWFLSQCKYAWINIYLGFWEISHLPLPMANIIQLLFTWGKMLA